MLGIDIVVGDLNSLLSDIINSDAGWRSKYRAPSLFDINFDISILSLDQSEYITRLQKQELQYEKETVEVIEDDNTIKIIANIPGIKKENINYEIKDGVFVLQIIKDRRLYTKEIPCRAQPSHVMVSSTLNNSVLEIVFKKQ